MWYVVLREGIPLGSCDLPPGELVAARLVALAAYDAVSSSVRAASAALLAFGLYGPPVAEADVRLRRARAALRVGASLRLELAELATGTTVPTAFVNLIEAPADAGVVVVARFLDSGARVPAALTRGEAPAGERADAP